MPGGRVQPFAPGGELRHTDEQAVFIKISALLEETDFDGGPAANTIAIPIGNVVVRRAALLLSAMKSSDVNGFITVAIARNSAAYERHQCANKEGKADRNSNHVSADGQRSRSE